MSAPYLELLGLDEEVLGDGEGLSEDLCSVQHLASDLLGRGREAAYGLGDELVVGHDRRIRRPRDFPKVARRRGERSSGGSCGLEPGYRRLEPLHERLLHRGTGWGCVRAAPVGGCVRATVLGCEQARLCGAASSCCVFYGFCGFASRLRVVPLCFSSLFLWRLSEMLGH